MSGYVGAPLEIAELKALDEFRLDLMTGAPVTVQSALSLGAHPGGFCRLDMQPRILAAQMVVLPVNTGEGSALDALRREDPEVLVMTPSALNELARLPAACIVRLSLNRTDRGYAEEARGLPVLGRKREAWGEVIYALSMVGFIYTMEWPMHGRPSRLLYEVTQMVPLGVRPGSYADQYLVRLTGGELGQGQVQMSGMSLREIACGFNDDPGRVKRPVWAGWPGERSVSDLVPRPRTWQEAGEIAGCGG